MMNNPQTKTEPVLPVASILPARERYLLEAIRRLEKILDDPPGRMDHHPLTSANDVADIATELIGGLGLPHNAHTQTLRHALQVCEYANAHIGLEIGLNMTRSEVPYLRMYYDQLSIIYAELRRLKIWGDGGLIG